MMKRLALILALLSPATALADTVIASRTLRAGTVLTAEDVALLPKETPGALAAIDEAVGKEARVNLYAGRPIRSGELGAPAIVERNQIVVLIYDQAGLTIATEGRTLDRGGVGDRVRVMNMNSRSTVTGTVGEDGNVRVTNDNLAIASR